MSVENKIVLVDYKMGNYHSVTHSLHRIGVESIISSDPEVILSADRIILVGVGHFQKAMENLHSLNLIDSCLGKIRFLNTDSNSPSSNTAIGN